MATPRPPSISTAPEFILVACVVSLNLADCALISPSTVSLAFGFANLTFSLNVTGPSNCDNICFDVPPSTRILSLTITSSATKLNLFGSSPVIVGIGISNVDCCPLDEEILVFPM